MLYWGGKITVLAMPLEYCVPKLSVMLSLVGGFTVVDSRLILQSILRSILPPDFENRAEATRELVLTILPDSGSPILNRFRLAVPLALWT